MNARDRNELARANLARQLGILRTHDLRGPAIGMFATPCGVWLALNTRLAGLPWRKTLGGATRRAMRQGAA